MAAPGEETIASLFRRARGPTCPEGFDIFPMAKGTKVDHLTFETTPISARETNVSELMRKVMRDLERAEREKAAGEGKHAAVVFVLRLEGRCHASVLVFSADLDRVLAHGRFVIGDSGWDPEIIGDFLKQAIDAVDADCPAAALELIESFLVAVK